MTDHVDKDHIWDEVIINQSSQTTPHVITYTYESSAKTSQAAHISEEAAN